MRKAVKRAVGVGVIAGGTYALWRAYKARVTGSDGGVQWEAAPFPFPPVPRPAPVATAAVPVAPVVEPHSAAAAAWVEPDADGSCPASHPVKGKRASGIYHLPGGQNYDRTKPDRCYTNGDAAEADGLRPAKR